MNQRNRSFPFTCWVNLMCTGLMVINLMGCKKDPADPTTPTTPSASVTSVQAIIVNNSNQTGTISMIQYPSGGSNLNAYTPPKSAGASWEYIDDVVRQGNNLYVARTLAKVIDVLDASTLAHKETYTYSNYLSQNYAQRIIAPGDGRIFVSGRDLSVPSFVTHSYIFSFPVTNPSDADSLAIGTEDADISSMVYTHGKLFASWNTGFAAKLEIIDANTLAIIESRDVFSDRVIQLALDNEGNVLMFLANFTCIKLDPSGNQLGDPFPLAPAIPNLGSNFRNSPSVSFDFSSQKSYFIQFGPQPASAPNVLKKYDFKTQQSAYLVTDFVSAFTLAFDPVSQILVYASGNSVTFMDTSGNKKGSYTVPYSVTEIIVN